MTCKHKTTFYYEELGSKKSSKPTYPTSIFKQNENFKQFECEICSEIPYPDIFESLKSNGYYCELHVDPNDKYIVDLNEIKEIHELEIGNHNK